MHEGSSTLVLPCRPTRSDPLNSIHKIQHVVQCSGCSCRYTRYICAPVSPHLDVNQSPQTFTDEVDGTDSYLMSPSKCHSLGWIEVYEPQNGVYLTMIVLHDLRVLHSSTPPDPVPPTLAFSLALRYRSTQYYIDYS